MTRHEAFERACRVWGRDRVISVGVRPDGGAAVNCRSAIQASDMRERNYAAHRLDANGHVACHDDCRSLEV